MKVSEIKKRQGVRKEGPKCGNCIHFSSEFVEYMSAYGGNSLYVKEYNKRCKLGEFFIGRSAWCVNHKFKN